MLSRDPCVRYLSSRQVWKDEQSTGIAFCPALEVIAFCPALEVRGALQEDPGANKRQLTAKVNRKLREETDHELRENIRRLPVQGALVGDDTSLADEAWATAVSTVPNRVMKFSLNAVCDTLPHRSNLKKWGKLLSDTCPLCKEGRQTLSHILNNCQKALNLRRYTIRHDAVLQVIHQSIRDHLPDQYSCTVDLPEHGYHFPVHIHPNNGLRPDIVLWSTVLRHVCIIELTVCYESNVNDARQRKTMKYTELVQSIKSAGYRCDLYPIQVGSRGYIDIESFLPIKNLLGLTTRTFFAVLVNSVGTAITHSEQIWQYRNISS